MEEGADFLAGGRNLKLRRSVGTVVVATVMSFAVSDDRSDALYFVNFVDVSWRMVDKLHSVYVDHRRHLTKLRT